MDGGGEFVSFDRCIIQHNLYGAHELFSGHSDGSTEDYIRLHSEIGSKGGDLVGEWRKGAFFRV